MRRTSFTIAVGAGTSPAQAGAPSRMAGRARTAAIAAAALAWPVVFAAPAYAHRSGCHAAHSCPSDTGSYVCGDTGNANFCGGSSTAAPQLSAPISPSVASTASGATAGPSLPTTGIDLTFGAWGGIALMLGVLLVSISKQMTLTQTHCDPSILPTVRRAATRR